MKMLRDMNGCKLINPKFIKTIRVESDMDGVMKRIVADVHRGGTVVLKQVNTYERAGAEAYIARQLELIEEAITDA